MQKWAYWPIDLCLSLQVFCRALILLRNKDLMPASSLLELFFELFRCDDKLLRKTLYNYIVNDIKNINAKHKNAKLNTVSINLFPRVFPCPGWGLLKPRSLISPYAKIPILRKYLLDSLNHIHICQVSPQLSCGDTCQI